MGIGIGISRDNYSNECPIISVNVNPDPSLWSVLDHLQIGVYLIVKIKYHNCTNYEGVKILVYKDLTLQQLKNQVKIDPHFSENKFYASPVARFEPTTRGWQMAKSLCEVLQQDV